MKQSGKAWYNLPRIGRSWFCFPPAAYGSSTQPIPQLKHTLSLVINYKPHIRGFFFGQIFIILSWCHTCSTYPAFFINFHMAGLLFTLGCVSLTSLCHIRRIYPGYWLFWAKACSKICLPRSGCTQFLSICSGQWFPP